MQTLGLLRSMYRCAMFFQLMMNSFGRVVGTESPASDP
jgi:hypothetical protein